MRFVSYQKDGQAGYGAVVGDGVVACAPLTRGEAPTLQAALELDLVGRLTDLITGRSPDFALGDIDLLPPVPNPRKILCIGVNYTEHRDEAKQTKTSHPVVFTRFPDSVVGHDRPVVRPTVTEQLDFEGEIAVVIGRPAWRVPIDQAPGVVAGYACFDDFSVRDWQWHSSQWIPGKNFAGVGSFGPWLTTAEEIADPQALTLTTRVNGELLQSASAKDMVFPVADLISYISTFSPLLPGDVIATGTPGGVGAFRDPPTFLQPGDLVEVEISSVGLLKNVITAPE